MLGDANNKILIYDMANEIVKKFADNKVEASVHLAQVIEPSNDFVFLAICHTANVEVYLLEAIERWTAINDHLMFKFVDGYLNASDPTTFNIRIRCTYGC